jgi:hypothetical protein
MAFLLPMPRTVSRLVLVACALLALLAPAAHASSTQMMTFESPRDLLNAQLRPGAMDQIQSLGAHALRVILYWKNVAPSATSKTKPSVDLSDPANYAWGEYDGLIAAAQERGWPVLVTISGPVPKWATASKKDNVTRPSPSEFRTFVEAVGKHYGPQVSMWSVWNEPNHPDFLLPQYDSKRRPVSGTLYRKLFLAAWQGLRATGNGTDTLLMGETAPRGTGKVVAPLAFLRQALCLSASYRKSPKCSNLPADGYAHHSYSTRQGPFFKPGNPDDVTMGVIGRLTRALDLAARAGAIRSNMGIYLDEFGVQSYPDKLLGVPLRQQPEYYAISEKLAYDNPRVKSFSQYLLRDDLKSSKGAGGGILAQSAFPGFESGLELAGGKRKPAYDGYRLPLVVTKGRSGVSLWGRVRPATAATSVLLQVRDGSGAWRKLATANTNAIGTFHASGSNRSGRTWRVQWTAPDGTVYTGPPIRAYPKP